MRRSTRLSIFLAASAVALAACSGGSGDATSSGGGSASASASGSGSQAAGRSVTTKVGVKVIGEPGAKPSLEIPASAAPTTTSLEVLRPGTGSTVAKGDVLIVDYLGQTWAPKNGAANVFDNSFDRGKPAGFPIGVGSVVKGWDATLVGQKVGSRVLLAVTPTDGYGPTASAQNELGGQTLVFVVDIKDTIKGDGVATGTAVSKVPAGFPTLKSATGTRPEVTSVKGVKPTAKPASTLVLKGKGDPIDAKKQLVLQYLQTDAATGKKTKRTWEANQPQVVPAESVLTLVSALKDQPVGSRAVVVTGQEASSPAQILVIDVIGQF